MTANNFWNKKCFQKPGSSLSQFGNSEKVMKRLSNLLTAVSAIALIVVGTVGVADAQRRNERQVRDLVRTLNAQVDDFQYGLDNHLRSTSSRTPDVETVHDTIRNLQSKLDDFEENLNNRRENRDDMRGIIDAAKEVDAFLTQNPQNRRIDTNWQSVRTTINSLASNYGVTPDWNTRGSNYPSSTPDNSNYPTTAPGTSNYPTNPRGNNRNNIPARTPVITTGLSGAYTLDTSRSENTADIVTNSGVGASQRQDLESKLEAPERISIDLRGNEVTLSSSKANAVTFTADGTEKTEQVNGRTIRLRATLRGEELTITSLGGETDYAVTFVPMDNGRTMKVTRRITTEYLSETVFAESFYNKTDSNAGLITSNDPDNGNYSSNDPNDRSGSNSPNPSISAPRTGQFIVPNGEIITGVLESSIDTKASQNNDRFRMTVQSPDQFRGATVEGYLTGVGRSGQISGRSNVTFNFESITLRDGKRYDFAGSLQSIKDQYGDDVRIDSEGTAKGDSQTKETAKRGGIGAGLGAIIGAIAGGGKGAAIGAIIGGGAGAGSVVVQGRDDLQLMKGSMITVQASSPNRSGQRLPQ